MDAIANAMNPQVTTTDRFQPTLPIAHGILQLRSDAGRYDQRPPGMCVHDGAIQKRLLAEPALMYGKAVELALGAETAAQSMRELGGHTAFGRSTSQGVHKMTSPHTSRSAHKALVNLHLPATAVVARDTLFRAAECGVPPLQERGHLQWARAGQDMPGQAYTWKVHIPRSH